MSDRPAARILSRVLPLLEAAGKDTMRMPDPGRTQRTTLDTLLKDTPELAGISDSFAQHVHRRQDRTAAAAPSSGQKQPHPRTRQLAVNDETGASGAVRDSVGGPPAESTLRNEARWLARLPAGGGAIGALA